MRTFEGHTDAVEAVSISPDGHWALSGSRGGSGRLIDKGNALKLWEMSTGHCMQTFEGHDGFVNSISFSPDGRWALSGGTDSTLKLWEVSTGHCIRTFKHTKCVTCVSISPDGRWALSGSEDKVLRLWEVSTGHCIRTFKHIKHVTCVSISPDGRWVLSGSGDRTLRLWEVNTGQCVRTFNGHTDEVKSISISPDGRWAISGASSYFANKDDKLRLWEISTGQCVRTFDGHTWGINSVSISSDGHWVLSGSDDHTLWLWELVWNYEFPEPADWDEGARPYLEIFLTLHCPYDEDGVSRVGKPVWTDKDFEKLIKDLQLRGYGWLRPEGVRRELERMTRERGGTPPLPDWHLRTFTEHSDIVYSVCFSPDGRQVLSGSEDTTLKLWEKTTGQCVRTFKGHTNRVKSIDFSPDGNWVISGSADKTLRLWEVATGQCVCIQEHTGEVNSVCFSPDGNWILSGSWDETLKFETLKLWKRATGERVLALKRVRTLKDKSIVTSVCFSPDGRWMLSGSDDITLKLWEKATGRCVRTFEGHTSSVTSVCFSPNGRQVLSGSEDKTLKLWELETGLCMHTFEGHTDSVHSICFSPDGHWIVSGSSDDTLKLWEVASGQGMYSFEGHTEEVMSISISQDGRWVLSGSRDGTLRLWELMWNYEFPEPADWDEGVRPYLENFLTLRSRRSRWLRRWKKPVWNDEDFERLLIDLQYRGYGWLRPEGVRHELEWMTKEWEGPSPLS